MTQCIEKFEDRVCGDDDLCVEKSEEEAMTSLASPVQEAFRSHCIQHRLLPLTHQHCLLPLTYLCRLLPLTHQCLGGASSGTTVVKQWHAHGVHLQYEGCNSAGNATVQGMQPTCCTS